MLKKLYKFFEDKADEVMNRIEEKYGTRIAVYVFLNFWSLACLGFSILAFSALWYAVFHPWVLLMIPVPAIILVLTSLKD